MGGWSVVTENPSVTPSGWTPVAAAAPARPVAPYPEVKEEPSFLSRISQATLGIAHPWDQVKSEWDQLANDPIGTLENAGKTAVMMPVNFAYQAMHHPLDTSESILPVNRTIADVKSGNYGAAAGDVVGAGANVAAMAAGRPGETPVYETNAAKTVGATLTPSVKLSTPVDAAAAAKDFSQAIPATKTTPYTVEQYVRARPYLEAEHAESAIGKDSGVTDVRDAADTAIGKIEDKVSEYIKENPTDRITTNPAADTKAVLAKNERGQEFVDAGEKEIQALNLDEPKTVAQADAIRRQLNLENQAALAKNNYKREAARVSDPAFAAREAASASLRDGIYDKLEERGIPGVQDLRQDEGALISIRNAAEAQRLNADKMIKSTGVASTSQKIKANLTRAAATGTGAAAGGAIAGLPGASAGAIIGAGIGEVGARAFTPEALTRNELVARSFSKKVAGSPEYAQIPAKPPIKGLLGTGSLVTPAPADTSGSVAGGRVAYSPTTRAERLGLLLGPKPGESLVTPAPRAPLQLPEKTGAPIITPANLSAREKLRMDAGKPQSPITGGALASPDDLFKRATQ